MYMYMLTSLAVAEAASQCKLKLTENVRINGHDIMKANATSSSECCDACSAHSECKAFLFVKPNICWIKRLATDPQPCNDSVFGGTISTPTPAPPTPAPTGCSTDIDCNMAGTCSNSVCNCDVGWTGEHCELIKFGKSYRCGAGGLCLNHSSASGAYNYSSEFTATWGGEVIRGDNDTDWHIYVASFANNSQLGAWLSKSRVVHGVASSPQGPYRLSDVALGPLPDSSAWDSLTQHNPAIQRDPISGTYLLYYMGSTDNATKTKGGGRCAIHPEKQSACNQRVGLATSMSPYGPWERRDSPIVDAGPSGSWDDQFTTNPTPHVYPNGSVLLVYKARSMADYNKMSTGAAFAAHWNGPYARAVDRPIDIAANCEDAGVYRSEEMGVYRMILHCGCTYQSVWSLDGIHWNRTAPAVPWCSVSYEGGGSEVLNRRERPKWVLDSRGRPTHMSTGVEPSHATHDGQTFTMIAEILP